MGKFWYPVIDDLTCIECGNCTEKCTHDVYDKAKAPSPTVVYPDGCIDHCHGCAIYVQAVQLPMKAKIRVGYLQTVNDHDN